MSELLIVRPQFTFEREFSMHRNWWVRDSRIAGYPISILLYLLSHSPEHPVTQTEAQRQLGIGKDAWASAKRKLMEAGFLIEIRDRWPAHARDNQGRPVGGQKRFRLVLQDPEQGETVDVNDAVIEASVPVDWHKFTQCGKSAVDGSPSADNPQWVEKSLVRASAENPQWIDQPVDNLSPSADNPQSLKEEKTGWDGIKLNPNPSLNVTTEATGDSETDRWLRVLHPSLSVQSLTHELRGRVDLTQLDLLVATRSILAAAKTTVQNPAAYVARSIVQSPWSYLKTAEPFQPVGSTAAASHSKCAAGIHNWGPEFWPEFERSICLWCDVERSKVDPAWSAKIATEFEEVG